MVPGDPITRRIASSSRAATRGFDDGASVLGGVAAALALGADGVWVGTRLIASHEAHVHPHHHASLLKAGGDDTVRSAIFGPEMPLFNPMRLLRTHVVAEYNGRLHEVALPRSDGKTRRVIDHQSGQ